MGCSNLSSNYPYTMSYHLPNKKDFPVRIAPATDIQHTGKSDILSKQV